MKRQPLLTTSGITAAVTAVIALLVAFGLDLTADQKVAILGVVSTVVVPAAIAWAAHGKVTPVADPKAADGTPLVKDAIHPESGVVYVSPANKPAPADGA